MPTWGWIIGLPLGALLLVALVAWLRRISPRGTTTAGAALVAIRLYARLWHRVRIEGREHAPDTESPGALVVVSNHSAGVDPLLIQSACRFEIRWVMAQDMRVRVMEPIWRFGRIIFVSRAGPRAHALRAGIRHLRDGGVLGLFPEGGIERPPRTLRPFRRGAGLVIERGEADVLPVVVDGTPEAETAWQSLIRPSRARVRFLERIPRADLPDDARSIMADLERRFAEATGWPRSREASGEAAEGEERDEAEGDGEG